MAFDFKKEYKEFYLPKNKPQIVTVPPMNYIAVRGKGDPNEEGGAYKAAIGVLYAIAYTIKMSKMGDHRIDGYFDWRLEPNKPPVLPGEIKTLVYEKITSDDRMVVVWRPHYQVSKEVINMERNEVNHSAHSTWRCQYHIVFAPKFRRKAIYGQLKADIGQILRKLCEEKKVEIIEAEACADHIHMLVSIPPHLSVAQFMGYLKGKSTLMIFDRHANLKYKYGSRHFWCRGYYVDTVGKNKKAIEEYIRNQLVEDEMMDQMTIKEYTDPFTGSKNSKA